VPFQAQLQVFSRVQSLVPDPVQSQPLNQVLDPVQSQVPGPVQNPLPNPVLDPVQSQVLIQVPDPVQNPVPDPVQSQVVPLFVEYHPTSILSHLKAQDKVAWDFGMMVVMMHDFMQVLPKLEFIRSDCVTTME